MPCRKRVQYGSLIRRVLLTGVMHRTTMQPHHLHSSSCAHSTAVACCNTRPSRQKRIQRTFVAQASSNGAENGRLTSEKQREIAKILLQTQKNMLELNNSRVKVQEELAMAQRRIADLERELERLQVEQARQQLKKSEEAAAAAPTLPTSTGAQQGTPPPQQQPTPAAPAAAAAAPPSQPATPPATPQQQQPQQQMQPQQQQQQQQPQQQQPQPPVTNHHNAPAQQQQQQVVQPAPPPPAAAPAPPPQQQQPPAPAPPAVINLTYISGWHNCFMHYSLDDKPWTAVPGQRLTTNNRDHMVKTITLQGRKLEFVMTNGENDWDSPGRYTEKPKNYSITAPGNYRLKSGKLELLPDQQ